MNSKQCTKCNIEKPFSEFYIDKRGKYGLRSVCKLCYIAYSIAWIKSHSKQYRVIKQKADRKIYSSIHGKLNYNMSNSIRMSLKGNKTGRHWESLVNFKLPDLIKYLEPKFLPGMTWDNYGKWHIDHIVPKSFFKYTNSNDQEFQYCWSLDNLQPLWAVDNFSKNAKLPTKENENVIYQGMRVGT